MMTRNCILAAASGLVVAMLLAATAVAQPLLNVAADTPEGAIAAGGDITDALQWALDEQNNPAGNGLGYSFIPYIPGNKDNRFVVSDTIYIRNKTGGQLIGYSPGINTLSGQGNSSVLFFDGGDTGKPMFVYQGANWTFENLGFAGRLVGQPTREQLGWVITMVQDTGDPFYNASAWGGSGNIQSSATTQPTFRNCFFGGFDTCMQCGSDADTSNSDFIILDKVYFYDAVTGYQNLNHFGQNLIVRHCSVPSNVGTAFKFVQGGPAYFFDCVLGGNNSDSVFLKLGSGIGHPVGQFVIDGFKFDASIDGTSDAELVKMVDAGGGYVDIYMRNIKVSNVSYRGNGGKLATLIGDGKLTVRDSYQLGAINCTQVTAQSRVRKPRVLLDNNAIVSASIAVEDLLTGDYQLVARDNYRWNGATPTGPNPSPGLLEDQPNPIGTITAPSSDAINVPISRGRVSTPLASLPKANQARRVVFNISGAPETVAKTVTDVTKVRVMLKTNPWADDSTAVFDKNSTDDAEVAMVDSAGVFSVDFLASDFSSAKIRPRLNYYVVVLLTITGVTGEIEVDQTMRLTFTPDHARD